MPPKYDMIVCLNSQTGVMFERKFVERARDAKGTDGAPDGFAGHTAGSFIAAETGCNGKDPHALLTGQYYDSGRRAAHFIAPLRIPHRVRMVVPKIPVLTALLTGGALARADILKQARLAIYRSAVVAARCAQPSPRRFRKKGS